MILALLIIGCSLSVGTAEESDAAADFTIDEIEYTKTGENTVSIRGHTTSFSTVNLIIPDKIDSDQYTVTAIGENAFYNCDSLVSVKIPNTITSIGKYAFYGSDKLKTVTLDEDSQLTSIGEEVFDTCYKLESVNLEKATELESIGDYAFYLCKLLNSLCSSTGYTDLELNKKLKTIGKKAFSDCWELESITIPNSVTTIGESAFQLNKSLETVNIKNAIIGDCMFFDCTSIKSVTFPETLMVIGSSPFSGITFHEADGTAISMGNIGKLKGSTFERSESAPSVTKLYRVGPLDPIRYELETSTSPNYVAVTGYNAAYFPSDGSVTIKSQVEFGGVPYDVTTIELNAFSDCALLKNIVIPDTITSIGNNAFKGCTALKSVSIPDSVTDIGVQAFYGCSDLGSATVGTGLTEISQSMFYNCGALENVTINGNVTSIGAGAFYGCKISSIDIPSTVTTIGDQAFQGCTSLSSIIIPDSVTTLEARVFYGCITLSSVTISNKVTSLPTSFFYNCTSLRNLTLGKGIESFGNQAFYGCKNISLTVLCPITYDMFHGCTWIKRLTIGSNIVTIGNSGFEYCTSLESVTFEENSQLTTIEEEAFYYCTALESIDFDKTPNLGTIGKKAFANCASIGALNKPVKIPIPVTSIGEEAFQNCTALRHISIPSSVLEIESDAFDGATFYDSDGTTTLQVTAESLRGFTFIGDSCEKLIKQAVAISHSVRYDANGGSATAPDEIQVEEGQEFTIAEYEGTKIGFTFGGWSYGGRTYQQGDTMTMGASDITLTAVWTSIAAHSVTYDPNGGTGYTPVQTDVEEGVAFQVQGYTGTEDGYTFGGWSYNGKTYQSGDMITMGGSDIVLTAIWNPVYVPVPDTDDDELPFYPVAPVQPVGGDDTTKTIAVVIAACAAALLAMMFLAFDRRS